MVRLSATPFQKAAVGMPRFSTASTAKIASCGGTWRRRQSSQHPQVPNPAKFCAAGELALACTTALLHL